MTKKQRVLTPEDVSCTVHSRQRDAWKNGDRVYILGLDYHVKDDVHWTDAVTNILQGKMTPFVVHPTKRVRSANGTVDMAHPIVVRLNYWRNIPFQEPVDRDSRASSAKILKRDRHTCAYCGSYATTADHVKPKRLCILDGDPFDGWTWGNLVAACFDCNQRKRDRYPEEAGMKLLWNPHLNGVEKYSVIQAEVWRVLETGEGYATEHTPAEGLIK